MSAPTGREQREAAIVEEVARAIHQEQNRGASWEVAAGYIRAEYRRLAAAAIAAYRAQDGGAEEAWGVKPDPEVEAQYRRDIADINRAEGRCPVALAAQAGDGAR